MNYKRENIIIFKSDRVGDLIHFSPCIKIIKENVKNSFITLVCSSYNYQVAKNYNSIDKFIILNKEGVFKTIIFNFKTFFLTKYKYLFQFDGKSKSYRISYFINAEIKSTICFLKKKKFLNFQYLTSRPSKIFLSFFFNTYVFRDENYIDNKQNKKVKLYQSLYFDIFEKLNFSIKEKKNIFFLDTQYKDIFNQFALTHIKGKYYLFHVDERWDTFGNNIYNSTLLFLNKLSQKKKIIITTGVKNFSFLNKLENIYKKYDYNDGNFLKKKFEKNNNYTIILKNMPLNLLAYFIKFSEKNFSAHSGPVVHIGAAFDKATIDIIKKDKNNELDRWIPCVANYTRINFENLNNESIDNYNF